jgi:hypothetical protein
MTRITFFDRLGDAINRLKTAKEPTFCAIKTTRETHSTDPNIDWELQRREA